MKNYKPLLIMVYALWISVGVHMFLLEVTKLKLSDLIYTLSGSLILLVGVYFYYFYLYFKNKKKVELLKQEYLDSLKPTKPLLFCPTDEELVKRATEKRFSEEKKRETIIKEPSEVTEEDEIMM